MNFRHMPFYLKYPIFQVIYIIFWIPVGFIVSYIFSAIIVSVVLRILSLILGAIFSFAFEMFLISGRMEAVAQYYHLIATIIFDFIFLIIGLELISYFLCKKRKLGGFNEYSIGE